MTFRTEASVRGSEVIVAGLSGVAVGMQDFTEPEKQFAVFMQSSSFPKNFSERGRPQKWHPANRWGQSTPDPMFDEGSLLRSIDYFVDPAAVTFGSPLKKAAYLQFGSEGLPGGVLRPRTAKFLTLPVVGPNALTKSQARGMRARDYPGAFPLMKGPQGPGIYRKATGFRGSTGLNKRLARDIASTAARRGLTRTIEILWRFVTEVRNVGRPFIVIQDEDVPVYVEFLMRYLERRART